jgi:hypothetical protein
MLEAGVSVFLSKPYDVNDLLQCAYDMPDP